MCVMSKFTALQQTFYNIIKPLAQLPHSWAYLSLLLDRDVTDTLSVSVLSMKRKGERGRGGRSSPVLSMRG